MAEYSPFSFFESLTANGQRNLHSELLIQDRSPEIVLALRILSGSAILVHNYSGTSCNCRKNYFSSDFKGYGQSWRTKFPKLISEHTTSEELGRYISVTKYINRKFYQNILFEISHFVYSTKKGNHSSAFIFLYRLLEKISYAFPLIYSSRTSDFVRSFTQLKSLMTGDTEKKELGFFKKFVETLYEDDPIAETSIDIKISASIEEIQSQIFNEFKNVLDDNIIHGDTDEPRQISIKYCEMSSFIITIRNRFFHNMNGGAKNIQSKNIADIDLFFESMNDLAMQWLATVFLSVFTYSYSNYQRNLLTPEARP